MLKLLTKDFCRWNWDILHYAISLHVRTEGELLWFGWEMLPNRLTCLDTSPLVILFREAVKKVRRCRFGGGIGSWGPGYPLPICLGLLDLARSEQASYFGHHGQELLSPPGLSWHNRLYLWDSSPHSCFYKVFGHRNKKEITITWIHKLKYPCIVETYSQTVFEFIIWAKRKQIDNDLLCQSDFIKF